MLFLLFLLGSALAVAPPSGSAADSPSGSAPQLKLQRGGCPMFWYGFNGRCFKYVATRMSWADAELHCVSLNANLVSIHSLEEEKFVRSLIKNYDPSEARNWIGLTDAHKEGRWMWSDGSALNFDFWADGEPNNKNRAEHCVHNNHPLKWNDEACSNTFSFVCVSRSC